MQLIHFPAPVKEHKTFVKKCTTEIPKFHLISSSGNFVETQSLRTVFGDSPDTIWKICLSTKLPHQEIR